MYSNQSNNVKSQGKLYLDFEFNREDSNNGRSRRGIESLLSDLRKKHGEALFCGWNEASNESLLDYVIRNYFPEKLTLQLYLSNLSLSENYWQLMIRLPLVPRLQRDMPRGLTVAFIGGVKEKHLTKPMLTIRDIKIVSATKRLPFELDILCDASLNKRPWEARENNVLNRSLLAALPPISKQTECQLEEWRQYLTFKKQVVHLQELGVRYLSFTSHADEQLVHFLVCIEQGSKVLNRLKRQELSVFNQSVSEDSWQFRPSIDKRISGHALGDYKEGNQLDKNEIGNYADLLDEVDINNPQLLSLTFELHDDDREFLDKQQFEPEEAKGWVEERFPKQGFIAISTAGDKAQINRHERALKKLEQQSGYNPMLSAFLFDICKADVSDEIPALPDEEMCNKALNQHQKDCVEKMLAAPDICMVQGPPGTGKTTVIAEAIYQLARRGDRVLLVSQAHLAVDNALERLPMEPTIRAIRLGPDYKISDGGKPFTKSNVLSRFYHGIAAKVQSSSLGVWKDLEYRRARCQHYIAKLHSGLNDLHRDQEQIASLEAKLTQYEQQQNVLSYEFEKQSAHFRQQHVEQQQAATVVKALQGGQWTQCFLPEFVSKQWQQNVLSLADDLRQRGLFMKLPGLPKVHDLLSTRLAYCCSFLHYGAEAIKHREQLCDDLQRLQCGEVLEDTALALQIARLKDQRMQLMNQIQEGDDSAVEKLRELGRELREVEGQQQGGLDRNVYEQLVNNDSVLLQSGCSEAEAEQALLMLVEAMELLYQRHPMLIAQLEDELIRGCQWPLVEPDSQPLDDIKLVLRKTRHELKQWQDHADNLHSNLNAYVLEAADSDGLLVNIQNVPASLEWLEHESERCETQLAGYAGFRQQWEPLLKRWRESLSADDLSMDNRHYRDDFVSHCNVVAITCNERDRTLEEIGVESFDTVIIDEVSKATPPELLMPIMRARRVILVGDHRQLPPVFQERYDESWEEAVAKAEESGGESLLTRQNLRKYEKMVTSSLFKQHFEQADARLKCSLFTQYRMHPQIMDLINVFYENRLRCGLADPEKERAHNLSVQCALHPSLPFITPKNHAYWVDSSRMPDGTPYYEQQAGTSKVNPLEVQLIVKALYKLNDALAQIKADKKKRVGVISFYGRQVRDLRKAIKPLRSKLTLLEIDVNTVDRFQGKEEDVIFVSMVRNTPSGKSGSGAYVAQFERINVALSRSRQLLLIFGASEMFRNIQVRLPNLDRPGVKQRRVYAEIIERLERNAAFFSTNALLHPERDHKVLAHLVHKAPKRTKKQNHRRRQSRNDHRKAG